MTEFVQLVAKDIGQNLTYVQTLSPGSQAAVHRVRVDATGEEAVLKRYNRPPSDVKRYVRIRDAWLDWSRGHPEERRVARLLHAGKSRFDGQDAFWELIEYIEGGTLDEIIGQRRNVIDLQALATQLYSAVCFIHSDLTAQRIVHCDLKPANILVRQDPNSGPLEIALTDFGISRMLESTFDPKPERIGFTFAFAPPEYFSKSPEIGAPADWWAVGVILAWAALGRHPFLTDSTNQYAVQRTIDSGPVVLDEIADNRLHDLLAGLLHRSLNARWDENKIGQWLAGQDPLVAADDQTAHGGSGGNVRPTPPYSFLGQEFSSAEALVTAMQGEWRVATTLNLTPSGYDHQSLVNWFQENGEPADVALIESDRDPAAKLAALAARFTKSSPVFQQAYAVGRSGELTIQNIRGITEEVLLLRSTDGSGSAGDEVIEADEDWLSGIFNHRILGEWAGRITPDLRSLDSRWRLVRREIADQMPDQWSFGVPEGYVHAVIIRALLDQRFRTSLQAQADEVASDPNALRQNWFFRLASWSPEGDNAIAREILLTESHPTALEMSSDRPISPPTRLGQFGTTVRKAADAVQYLTAEPPKITQLELADNLIANGDSTTLTWAVANADQVLLNREPVAASGTRVVAPDGNVDFTIEAFAKGDRTDIRTRRLEVDRQPVIRSLEVDRRYLVLGQELTVYWDISGARAVLIDGREVDPRPGRHSFAPERTGPIEVVVLNSAGRAFGQTPRIEVWDKPAFETQVALVPVVDCDVTVPIALLPDMEGVLRPDLHQITGLMDTHLSPINAQIRIEVPFPEIEHFVTPFPGVGTGGFSSKPGQPKRRRRRWRRATR